MQDEKFQQTRAEKSTAPCALSGFVFNKWTETVVVDLEMVGVDCAECLVLMWLIVISGRSLSETFTDSF